MQNPTVSFVVPCYKLARFLPECISSILSQSFRDIEVLIMDDCSPDNTAEVANAFQDSRIRYVRNETTLGPLRNYNKGIGLSRGKYVWLISADDYLRRPYVLDRYVEVLEAHPKVGYTFCSGVGVRNGTETQLVEYSRYSARNEIVEGRVFLTKLLNCNIVLAASVLVRRQCYEEISFFPLGVVWAGMPIDMAWGGDWYLWLLFALFFDVGYFAEPMVCYREHELNMTNTITQERTKSCWAAELAVLWMIKRKAVELGLQKESRACLRAITSTYTSHMLSKEYSWLNRSSHSSITIEQFEESLCQSTNADEERDWIRARTFTGIADRLQSQGDTISAKKFYVAALKKDPRMAKVYAKILLLLLGKGGDRLRGFLRSCCAN
jgi:glycosyltransferase involved in cell wall biosynthesis